MSTTYGYFKKIDGSNRFYLKNLITSKYETEALDSDSMMRDITSFDQSTFNVETLLERNLTSLVSFGTDNTIALHPDIQSIEYVDNQTADPVNGVNEVQIVLDNLTYSAPPSSDFGVYLITQYPTGYTAP